MSNLHDKPGPLHASPALLEVLRLCYALGEGPDDEALALDVAVVHAIEAELSTTLPDDVLVVLACRSPILACATGLALDAILDCAEDWSKGVPEDHVAISYLHEEPFAERREEAECGAYEVIAIPRSGARTSPHVLVVRDGAAVKKTTLGAFAREKIAAWYGRDGRRWLDALHLEATLPLEDPSFKPALVGDLPAPKIAVDRFVVHPKFGRGRVVEARAEHGETKLVVDFEGAGRKTLMDKFVSEG